MTIRTACFVGAIIAPGVWRWVLVVGAVILPYVAVVLANAGREAPTGIDLPADDHTLAAGTDSQEPEPAPGDGTTSQENRSENGR